MKYIASCSFGKDSLAMVLRLIKEEKPLDEIIFFDTGVEFDSIYRNRDRIRILAFEKGVKYTELRDDYNFFYNMMVRPVKYKDQEGNHYGYEWCGGRTRWETRKKVSTIKKYYASTYPGEEIFEYVGIACDETNRISDDPHKIYPLIEWGMTESDCLKFCYDNGFSWDEDGVELYSILDRVSCWCCQNKNLKELKNMYVYLPKYWERLKGIQSRCVIPMKGKGKSVFELESRFKKETENMNGEKQ